MTKGDKQFLMVGAVVVPVVGLLTAVFASQAAPEWNHIGVGVIGSLSTLVVLIFVAVYGKPAVALAFGGLFLLALTWGGLIEYGKDYFTEWTCIERGNTMLSISEKGDLGPAEKACTCTGMADFERRKFGRVDYASLNKDHGCSFD
jgi:hypothetical protein